MISKESHNGEEKSQDQTPSQWDILMVDPRKTEVFEESNNEAEEIIAEQAPFEEKDDLDSSARVESIVTTEEQERRERREAERRHDRALIAASKFIFDHIAPSKKDAALIKNEGGISALREQVIRENAASFRRFALTRAYEANGRDFYKLSEREWSAIKYLSRQANMSAAKYMETERVREAEQRVDAMKVIRNAIISNPTGHPVKYTAALSIKDYDKISDFDVRELENVVREGMYLERHKEIVGKMSGHDKQIGIWYNDKIAREGKKFIIEKYGNGSESRAEQRLRQMADETFHPSAETRAKDDARIEKMVDQLIPKQRLEAIAIRLEQTKELTTFCKEIESLVKQALPYSDELSKVKVRVSQRGRTEEERNNNKATMGYYVDTTKEVTVNVGVIKEVFVGDNREQSLKIAETLSHELFHAFQHIKTGKSSSEDAVRLAINTCDYREPKYITPYRDQLMEREARAFGGAIKKYLKEIMERK